MEKELFWSADTEMFNYESLQELIDCEDVEVGDEVEFGEKVEHSTSWVSAGDIIEMIGERGWDEGGEYAEDFPDVDDAAKAELEAFISDWQAKHCKANFYRLKNVGKYTITEADIASRES